MYNEPSGCWNGAPGANAFWNGAQDPSTFMIGIDDTGAIWNENVNIAATWNGNQNFGCNRNRQAHVHETLGSVRIVSESGFQVHNHRFSGITSIAFPSGNSHVHRLTARTDFCEGHFHEIQTITGPAIPIGNGRHVHFVRAFTSCNDGHRHGLIASTLIENPMGMS